ncbi:hypothetical protein [Nocardiopsis sp. CNR-923]|uniref:hypothetical protein n=1 Tax=Nocardiopsis sp. CNR-923 TaxID=1904965 RepID=UPI0013018398|nr:hypothetical protein [Nocardiopsis sp. CNR-923]
MTAPPASPLSLDITLIEDVPIYPINASDDNCATDDNCGNTCDGACCTSAQDE